MNNNKIKDKLVFVVQFFENKQTTNSVKTTNANNNNNNKNN